MQKEYRIRIHSLQTKGDLLEGMIPNRVNILKDKKELSRQIRGGKDWLKEDKMTTFFFLVYIYWNMIDV